MATKTEIIAALEILAEIYGQEPPSTRGYYLALEDVDPDDLHAAIRPLVKASRFFPAPAELRAAAIAVERARDRRGGDYIAAEVVDVIHRVHHGEPEAFDPDRLEDAARLYDRLDRPARADWVREKARRLVEFLRGDDDPASRRRYDLPPGYAEKRDRARPLPDWMFPTTKETK